MTEALKWWQRAVFYQVYPRSFADGNGDGIGDLGGLLGKLDYLANLGIDAIWLSPHYPSPQVDCGYDIADYTAVAPEYGTMDDFCRLLTSVHERDMRLILDLVLNHTSDQHAWFRDSRSDRDSPRRNWYIWRHASAGGGPPNDWLSTFGGPAWEFDTHTGQYYYHFFFKEQPDLNWRNPAVKRAMFDVVRFWLELGVDGFRLDAIGTIFEDPTLQNHSTGMTVDSLRLAQERAHTEKEQRAADELWRQVFGRQADLPEVHELMKELRALVDEYDDRVLVGETHDVAFYGDVSDELNLVFNFPLMWPERLSAVSVMANQQERIALMPDGAWPCNTLGNHDSSRIYSRYGDGVHDEALARLSLALMVTLRGTPFLYYGEEIGMSDLLPENLDDFRDTLGIAIYEALQEERGLPAQAALRRAATDSRDKCRTPMQWGRGANADFCPAGTRPWLPVNPNHMAGVNVMDELADPNSMLAFYRTLLCLRRGTPALVEGDYSPVEQGDSEVLVFMRNRTQDACLVVLNFAGADGCLQASPVLPDLGRVLYGSHRPALAKLKLPGLAIFPFEILICEV